MGKKFLIINNEKSYDDIINKYSAKYGVPASLIKAIIQAESSWDERAFRDDVSVDSYGLMQISDILIQDYGYVLGENVTEETMYDPDFNIMIGTRKLSSMLKKYPLDAVIQMYNRGVSGYINKGYRNQIYLARVLNYKAQYEAI